MDPAVIGKKVKTMYPQYAEVDDAKVGQAYLSKFGASIQGVQSGILSIEDLPQNQRPGVSLGLEASGYKKPLTSDEKEAADKEKQAEKSKAETIALVDDIISRDTGAVAGVPNVFKYLTGENKYTKKLVEQLKGKLSLEARQQLKGSGQISDYEMKILENSVGALSYGLSNEDFKKELLRIKDTLSGNIEGRPSVEAKKGPTGNAIIDFLLGGAINTARDVGAGIGMNMEAEGLQKSQAGATSMAQLAAEKAKQIQATNPEQASKLLQVAQQGNQTVSQGASQLTGMFSPDVQRNPIERGFEAGGQIASTGATASSLLNLLTKGLARGGGQVAAQGSGGFGQKIVDVAEKIRSKLPQNVLGEKQTEAALRTVGKVKPNVKVIIDAGKELAKTDPDIGGQLAKNIPKINNIKDIPTLLGRMQVWGRNAYSSAGGIKSSAKAELYKEFYGAGIKILKEQAPEVYKNRQLLRLTFELPKTLGKTLWRATLGKVLLK